MPQFNYNTPQAPSTLRESINKSKQQTFQKPIGVIAETMQSSWGYDGTTYYVTIGIVPQLLFGKMQMTLEQAKAAYHAMQITHLADVNFDVSSAKKTLRAVRKTDLSGDALLYFFCKAFRKY